ncbi:MAG: insulinase family protein, partial [Pseudomonadota bacterium]
MFETLYSRCQSALLILFFALLAACASLNADRGPKPAQSPNDDYQYRFLTLDNQMQVLLISDPSTPKAAAALDVLVGSGDNPPGREGLAHFLEHMLFLGTDKYPDAAEYEEFVTEHGGNRNAYTSFEHTNYFFDINADNLAEGLDRFAQFFIAPRFDSEYVDREMNAVQAEYQMGLKSDARRGLDVLQQVMNPEHPFSQFSVGSLDTLADRPGDPIRDDLLAFYDKHYSANVMRLVVFGAEPLDELEKLVVPMFAAVPNRDYVPEQISAPLMREGDLPLEVRITPQATLRELQVSFPLPEYREFYRAKPLSYLGNLVGHEGAGSLLSQLKAEGLAESLGAGSGLAWRGGSMFSVSVSLTEKGVAEQDRILELLFSYLDMLREEGPQAWLYEEQSQLADLRFRFKEKVDPMRYVSSLASNMHYYSAEDVLQGPFMMTDYDADLLNDLTARLTRDNALVIVTDSGVETNSVSQYYEVPYASERLSEERVASWQSEGSNDLRLPEPNTFIAEDVSLVEIAPDNPEIPEMVMSRGRQQLWFQQDEEFRVPKGAAYVNFRTPMTAETPAQRAASGMYTALLKDAANELTYPALLAGLGFDLYSHGQGITLRISGYNDKQLLLLDELLALMKRTRFDQQRFDNIRGDRIRAL